MGGLGQGMGEWDGVKSGLFVLTAGPGICIRRIPAHLRCTQCSILSHLITFLLQEY